MIRLSKPGGPWYGAGKKFGWKGAGLGIDFHHLQENSPHEVIEFCDMPGKPSYYITVEAAQDLVNHYKSFHMVKGVLVAVVPFSECFAREKLPQPPAPANSLFS